MCKKRAEVYLFVKYLVTEFTVTNSNLINKIVHVHNNVEKVLFSI
jgi:hypothetical protein